ncbi:MAG: PD-(D/E)XK nuclease family protein [Planctomycetota bacterium]|jgi:ATP-dependent helicase/nuclease subunit B
MSFMEDLAYAFSDLELTIEELADVLEQGFSNLTLGLAPPMIDQVLVGSIDRSRHPDIQAAIILGFNDGVFPHRPGEDAILNDDDRTLLTDQGLSVAPPVRDRVLDEALLVYVAMTRASDALVVTYATADNDGKALQPSPYVSAFQAACPGLTATTIGDPTRLRETWDVLSSGDLAERVLMEFRTRPGIEQDNKALRGRWNALYDGVRSGLAEDAALRWAMTSLHEQRDAKMSPTSVKRLIPGSLQTSVSRLETYATCPFQYFARYGLKLRERAEAPLAPVDVGRVHHAILEDFVHTLSQGQGRFAQLSDTELLGHLHKSCGRIATRLPAEGVMSDARNAYLLRRSASYLARVLRGQRRVSQAGTARPRAAELPFGFDKPDSLPALELTTPAGRHILLRGYIDRVDLAELGDELLGIVIDYKRTRDKHLELDEVHHGLSLQLLAYLLVLAEHGVALTGRRIRPIAGLYVSLASKYNQVDHPELVSPREQRTGATFRPRGVMLADAFDALDNSTESGWSDDYSFYRKKDGRPGHIDSSDAAGGESFNALLDHTRAKLAALADGILSGDIAVNPYRLGTFSPCSWCPMDSVCRFEMGISDVRFLETLKRSDVFKRLTGEIDS